MLKPGLPKTPKGRVALFGGGALLILVVAYIVKRRRDEAEAAAAAEMAAAYVDPSAPDPYSVGSTYLSPVSSGISSGGGGYGSGSVTTYTMQDIMDILKSLQPPPPTVPTPNVPTTPEPVPVAPAPVAPPPVAPAPAPVQETPAPAPAPGPAPCPAGWVGAPGRCCPPDFPLHSSHGCYKVACASGKGAKRKGRWHFYHPNPALGGGREVWVNAQC